MRSRKFAMVGQMRFSLDQAPGAKLVSAWRPGEIRVGENRYRESIVLRPGADPLPWPVTNSDMLTFDSLAPALESGPDVLLLGTGSGLVFPDPAVYARVLAQGVGMEVMDTGAACRTYNILIAEDRTVVAALIVD
ncbi:MAG: Mth938-like domain-containing protein [Gammaproteobacteria bacterium]